jgi:EAL domain-containing protein (putative c-di-GMP-specific phosphodiesterase class I)
LSGKSHDEDQGYFFSKPVNAAQMQAMPSAGIRQRDDAV